MEFNEKQECVQTAMMKTEKIQYRDTVKILYDILLACSYKNMIISYASRKANLNGTTVKL